MVNSEGAIVNANVIVLSEGPFAILFNFSVYQILTSKYIAKQVSKLLGIALNLSVREVRAKTFTAFNIIIRFSMSWLLAQ